MELQDYLDVVEKGGQVSNRDIVEVIVYFLTVIEEQDFATTRDVRLSFSDLHMAVPSRVAAYLSEGTRKKNLQFVKKGNGYALHRNLRKVLDTKFDEVKGVKQPDISFEVLSIEGHSGGRKYLSSMITQINGTYSYGFYDATAVLMRRLMESLLIETFIKNSLDEKILDADNNFLPLNAIINQAKNPANIRFSRGLDKTMEGVKDVGDAAAHNKSYITKKSDIDNIQSRFRRMIDELCKKAQIT